MTELRIGKKIKEQRKLLNLTQEDLAKSVGISVSAVSKWESGNSYPDIALLVPISRMLNLTVDELLDNSKKISENEVPLLGNQAKEYFENRKYLEGIAFCQKRIGENQYCFSLQYHFAMLIVNYLSDMDEDEQKLAAQTAISWLENSSKISEPIEIKLASLHYLGQLYLLFNEDEKARETFSKLPIDMGLDFASNIALLYTQGEDYEQVNEFCEEQLYINICYACSNLMYLSNVAAQMKDFQKSFDLSELHLKLLDLFNINSERYIFACWQMSFCGNEMSNKEITAHYLDKMVSRLNNLTSSPTAGNHLFTNMKKTTQVVSEEAIKATTKSAIQVLLDKYDFTKNKDFASIIKRFSNL